MSTNDENARPEQRRPDDVAAVPEKPAPADEQSLAPASLHPEGVKDVSERPVVNPVTGAAI
jgi:hypothetical protein